MYFILIDIHKYHEVESFDVFCSCDTMFVCVAPQDRGGAYGRGTSIVEGPIECLGDPLGSEPR